MFELKVTIPKESRKILSQKFPLSEWGGWSVFRVDTSNGYHPMWVRVQLLNVDKMHLSFELAQPDTKVSFTVYLIEGKLCTDFKNAAAWIATIHAAFEWIFYAPVNLPEQTRCLKTPIQPDVPLAI